MTINARNILSAGLSVASLALLQTSCGSHTDAAPAAAHSLAVVAPGHFHAALVTKSPIAALADTIRLYAPQNAETEQYEAFISDYNRRPENPTAWVIDEHLSDSFLDSLEADTVSDIVVLAGNNRFKTDYILSAVRSGKNVLADKPLAIDAAGYDKLVEAYSLAEASGLTIRELMTERYDTINIFTRMILNSGFIGEPAVGTELPTVEMESVHHFYKEVSGKPLRRPEWYYDTDQQGEGIADVTTHLIDLIMWQLFPDTAIDPSDVEVISATHSTTTLTPEQYLLSTGAKIDEPIEVYANGTIRARIKDIVVSLTVRWDFEAPEGSGDTFSATYRYTDGQLYVAQDKTTNFIKEIFIHKYDKESSSDDEYISVEIPVAERTGHEDHFNRVTDTFLRNLDGIEPIPAWEDANTLAKYRITTGAVNQARKAD